MAPSKGTLSLASNYLLDPSYQLRFTLTILTVAAGLMAPLGWWVSQEATTATEVALNQMGADLLKRRQSAEILGRFVSTDLFRNWLMG